MVHGGFSAHGFRHRVALDLRQPGRPVREHQRGRARRRPARGRRIIGDAKLALRHWATRGRSATCPPTRLAGAGRGARPTPGPSGAASTPTSCSTSRAGSGDSDVVTTTDAVLTQGQLIGVLQEHARPGDIIVAAAGGPPGDLLKSGTPATSGRCHLEFGYSCMGYEFPPRLACASTQPRGEVAAFLGDGTYLMNPAELVTAAQGDSDHGGRAPRITDFSRSMGCPDVPRRAASSATSSATARSHWSSPTPPRSREAPRLSGDYLSISTSCRSRLASAQERCAPALLMRSARRWTRPGDEQRHGRPRRPGHPPRRPAPGGCLVGRRSGGGLRVSAVAQLRARVRGPPPVAAVVG